MKLLSAIAAVVAVCSAFAYTPTAHTNVVTRDGVTYAQRGGLGAADYVVTNIVASALGGGKVESVNGKTGIVVIAASDLNLTNFVTRTDPNEYLNGKIGTTVVRPGGIILRYYGVDWAQNAVNAITANSVNETTKLANLTAGGPWYRYLAFAENGFEQDGNTLVCYNTINAGDDMVAVETNAWVSDLRPIATTVSNWESYWGGSNVCWEVTNYYGQVDIPKLRLKELITDGGTNYYQEVWNDITKFDIFTTNIMDNVTKSNAVCKSEILGYVDTSLTDKAPLAWGAYTDQGNTNNAPQTTWFENPQTVFAGNTDYKRIAVGNGAICVLATRGDNTYTAGEEGTFRFQDEGGTNYFGFAKSESYTIGCNADGIKVENQVVTLEYDVTMGDGTYPIIYYTPTLTSPIAWEQLNNTDGTAIAGATYTVTWGTEGAKYLAFINVGNNPQGFFRAETQTAGDVIFETNMKARLSGGIACSNTVTGVEGVVRPTFNGSTVNWTWSAK